MKKTLQLIVVLFVLSLKAQVTMTPSATAVTAGANWTTTKITANNALNYPWEITVGPDGDLWVTERVGEKISRISTTTATNTPITMLDLSAKVTYSKQGGLMGMAIHPDLYNPMVSINNYVFVSYTYNDGGDLKLRIARLVYNSVSGTLTEDVALSPNGAILEGVPASGDHNSGRLIFGPDNKLYYTIGDQGANQFDYACNPILAQILPTSSTDYDNYPGKTLRINIDGSIPNDNPTLNGVKSHVYTYGHRNAQGIVFAADGTLYASEHGAKVDDEINIIKSGKNYGWPQIAGYYDNMAYTYCNWSSLNGTCNAGDFSDHNCPAGAETATEFESYPTSNDLPVDFEPPIGTYGGTVATDPPGGWFTWPSVAPSSIDIHEANTIPNWGRSLLIPTLKKGTIYRAKLTANGSDIIGDDNVGSIDGYEEFHSSNDRYRDIAISPDGLTIYAVTDNAGGTSGPSSNSGVSISNPGVIIKIEYVGPQITNAPIANCQDITIALDAFGQATITPADIDNGSTNVDTMFINQDTFDCSHIGIPQEVYLTVISADGGEDTCAAMVTVNNTSEPITAPVLADVSGYCFVTAIAPVLNYNCVDYTGVTSDPTNYTSEGAFVVQWTFDAGSEGIVVSNQNVIVNPIANPANVIVTSVTNTSAELEWDILQGTTYQIRYRVSGASAWTTIASNTNSVTLTGLDFNTNYEAQVRAVCGTSYSNYSNPLITFSTTDITYCASQGVSNGYISNVSINGESATFINNSSSGNSSYTNYTAVSPVTLKADGETSYSLSVNTSFNASGVAVWIDYNQNGSFNDEGEKVWDDATGITGNSPRVNTFIIPLNTPNGTTRIRIASRQYWTPSVSCGDIVEAGQDSEVEDYMVNIVAPTLSIQNFDLAVFSVYPNPIKDAFSVKLSNLSNKETHVKLIDLQGRIIQQKIISKSQDTTTFNQLSQLNSGVYFITIVEDNKTLASKKIIKI
ncbi:PQQ-dependent sugar dehydrogenase [Olleya sp. AS48]|uniref:PQQ-dependent sugar dehydrogenase n=1 Tax=Olleya sp. AS48 TaxID=3135774 RepID=UPI00316BCD9B